MTYAQPLTAKEKDKLFKEHLARYPDVPAPMKTVNQFEDGEIDAHDFNWLCGFGPSHLFENEMWYGAYYG